MPVNLSLWDSVSHLFPFSFLYSSSVSSGNSYDPSISYSIYILPYLSITCSRLRVFRNLLHLQLMIAILMVVIIRLILYIDLIFTDQHRGNDNASTITSGTINTTVSTYILSETNQHYSHSSQLFVNLCFSYSNISKP